MAPLVSTNEVYSQLPAYHLSDSSESNEDPAHGLYTLNAPDVVTASQTVAMGTTLISGASLLTMEEALFYKTVDMLLITMELAIMAETWITRQLPTTMTLASMHDKKRCIMVAQEFLGERARETPLQEDEQEIGAEGHFKTGKERQQLERAYWKSSVRLMNLHSGADCAVQPDHQAEQPQRAAAAEDPACSSASCSSGASPSWPPATASNVSSTSFFGQLFSEEDDSAAARAAISSSYAVDDLLLPPAAAPSAFDNDNLADPASFHLGAFSMVDSFIDSTATGSDGAPSSTLGQTRDHTTGSRQPHTLEFVSPIHNACARAALATSSGDHGFDFQYRSKTNPRQQLHPSDHGDDQESTMSAKKARLGPADDQHCSNAVDPSQLQSLISKVNQSQSARSKEKLGERINALQQLVSPFGKTDTASVLSEAIGYIKFLQEQVQVLSSPYMKNTSTLIANSRQDIGADSSSDLRSRGLCLVPVSCTMSVANNNNFNIGADYWASTPTLSSTMGSSAPNTVRHSATS
ncbi:hypothetical protein GOP47_0009826 [Adiantum capillus-veneris]|uniref:BHLH domain-containing protein n=1 Tax=Adiantum capillus-veneris TaxID=13818 RepID=A0A9D4UX00_ADICA|nr:hypothetical protein GOP47_0009826 [Adiantum capillus-veneris]